MCMRIPRIVGFYTNNSCEIGKPTEFDWASELVTELVTEDEEGSIQVISPPANLSDIASSCVNENSGTVIYIRQLHYVPEMNEADMTIVGEYQMRIWQELERRKVTDIFVESLYEDLNSQSPIRRNDDSRVLRTVFPNGIPEEPTDLQLLCLALYGSYLIYFYVHSEITLHKTLSEEESASIDSEINRAINVSENILGNRERFASREIEIFFENNPGATIVLIYGALHEFRDNLEGLAEPPILIDIDFPEIRARLSSNLSPSLNS